VNIRWRPATYGARPTLATTNQVYANFGLDGKLFDDRVTWNITHTYSQSDALVRTPNQINSVALNNLLNTAACAADRVCTGIGAVPNIANLLSGATRLTAAQQSYMFFTQTSDNKFSSAQTIATASGTLFKLPAGDVDLAVGYEHRKETGKITPDALTQQGVAIGSFVFPTDGQFSTDEAFGELNIPLVKDAPLMKDLTRRPAGPLLGLLELRRRQDLQDRRQLDPDRGHPLPRRLRHQLPRPGRDRTVRGRRRRHELHPAIPATAGAGASAGDQRRGERQLQRPGRSSATFVQSGDRPADPFGRQPGPGAGARPHHHLRRGVPARPTCRACWPRSTPMTSASATPSAPAIRRTT
jgi:hypothetical protein